MVSVFPRAPEGSTLILPSLIPLSCTPQVSCFPSATVRLNPLWQVRLLSLSGQAVGATFAATEFTYVVSVTGCWHIRIQKAGRVTAAIHLKWDLDLQPGPLLSAADSKTTERLSFMQIFWCRAIILIPVETKLLRCLLLHSTPLDHERFKRKWRKSWSGGYPAYLWHERHAMSR